MREQILAVLERYHWQTVHLLGIQCPTMDDLAAEIIATIAQPVIANPPYYASLTIIDPAFGANIPLPPDKELVDLLEPLAFILGYE